MNEMPVFTEADYDLVEEALDTLKTRYENRVEMTKKGLPGHPLHDLFKMITSLDEGREANNVQAATFKKQLEEIAILSGKLVQMKRQHRQQNAQPNTTQA